MYFLINLGIIMRKIVFQIVSPYQHELKKAYKYERFTIGIQEMNIYVLYKERILLERNNMKTIIANPTSRLGIIL